MPERSRVTAKFGKGIATRSRPARSGDPTREKRGNSGALGSPLERPPAVRPAGRILNRVHTVTLTAGGLDRRYLLVPAPADAVGPVPLVVFLHGAGGTAAWADDETGWSRHAAHTGFALALPEGLPPDPGRPPKFLTNPQRWNDGSPGPTGEPATADDVAFLAAVVADARTRTAVDPRRVYVTGFSNGAGMAFRAAAELADRVAAVAPVAGYCWVGEPKPTRPVPTLYIVGSADPLIPLRGGEVRSPWRHRLVRRPAVADTLERWAAAVGADVVPRAAGGGGGVRADEYPARPGGAAVRAVVVDGLGHHWAGGKGQLVEAIGGKPSDRLDATSEVWDFFKTHSLP